MNTIVLAGLVIVILIVGSNYIVNEKGDDIKSKLLDLLNYLKKHLGPNDLSPIPDEDITLYDEDDDEYNDYYDDDEDDEDDCEPFFCVDGGSIRKPTLLDAVDSMLAAARYDATVENSIFENIKKKDELAKAAPPMSQAQIAEVFASAIQERYPYITPANADNVLQQLDRFASLVAKEESTQMEVIQFMGKKLVHFKPGTAIVIGDAIDAALCELEALTGTNRLQSIVDAIIFFRHWQKAHNDGRIRPLYNEYGTAMRGILVMHLGDNGKDDKDKWEPTEAEKEVLRKLNFNSWVQ